MKIYLYFQEYKLGSLEKCEDKFLWIPIADGIDKAKKEYPFSMVPFYMDNKEKLYDKIPHYYADNNISNRRTDIIEKVGITKGDDLFTRLYKISTLEYNGTEFYIKNK